MDTTDLTTTAKLFPIPAAFIMAGYGYAASQSTVPLLYSLPTQHATAVFKGVYYQGAKVIPVGAAVVMTCSAYLAYNQPSKRTYYLTAAGLIIGTQVLTAGVMLKGINRLIAISSSAAAEQAKADVSGEAVKLMKAWVTQNYIRSSLSLASGLVSLYTSFVMS